MKKLLTCCFISFISAAILTAQQRQIDSLKALVRVDKEDTLKVKHLNKLASLYTDIGDMKKSLDCGINASLISERLFYPAGLAKAYSNVANTYYLQADYTNALYYYSHSLDLIQRIGNKSAAASIITNMGLIYDAEGRLPKRWQLF